MTTMPQSAPTQVTVGVDTHAESMWRWPRTASAGAWTSGASRPARPATPSCWAGRIA